MSIDATIADLEARLKEAKEIQKEELEARRKIVEPVWEYTIRRIEKNSFDRIYDESVISYELAGRMVNREQWESVGNHDSGDASITWYYNTLSGRLIGMFHGGTSYIGFGWGMKEAETAAHLAAVRAIGDFLVDCPDGGNITDIVETYKAAKA